MAKMTTKIQKASHSEKDSLFIDACPTSEARRRIMEEIVLSLPGDYRLAWLQERVFEVYGAMASRFVTQEIILGLAVKMPARVSCAFTHDMTSVHVCTGTAGPAGESGRY